MYVLYGWPCLFVTLKPIWRSTTTDRRSNIAFPLISAVKDQSQQPLVFIPILTETLTETLTLSMWTSCGADEFAD